MAILILDPLREELARAWQRDDRYDEVWDGVTVMSPSPNNQHQAFVTALCSAFLATVRDTGHGEVYAGCNVSDREDDWTHNYRCPDVAVYLPGNPAEDRETYMFGGPDLAVEIVSPGEDPLAKLDFYAAVNTREVLIVRRDPWELELFRLAGQTLESAGRVDLAGGVLAGESLGLTLKLVPGTERPQVEVTEPATERVWLA